MKLPQTRASERNKIEILLFDWDGTVINSQEIKITNAGKLFEEYLGYPGREVEELFRLFSGIPRRKFFDLICTELGHPPLQEAQFQAMSRDFTSMNLDTLTNPVLREELAGEARQTLPRLHEQGYRMYISSSAERDELCKLAGILGLDVFFVNILGSAPGFSKGPEHVDYVLQTEMTTRAKVAFIGDDPADIRLGRAAGVTTLGKSGTHPRERLADEAPDVIFSSLSELLDILPLLKGKLE